MMSPSLSEMGRLMADPTMMSRITLALGTLEIAAERKTVTNLINNDNKVILDIIIHCSHLIHHVRLYVLQVIVNYIGDTKCDMQIMNTVLEWCIYLITDGFCVHFTA